MKALPKQNKFDNSANKRLKRTSNSQKKKFNHSNVFMNRIAYSNGNTV